MSNALAEFSLQPITPEGITKVVSGLPEQDYKECSEFLDTTPDEFLREAPGYKREILDGSGATIGHMGITDLGNGISTPWILLREDYKKPNPREYIAFAKAYLMGVMNEERHTLLVIKSVENTDQIRLLKLLGFQRNPDVTIIGYHGGELHEYFIKRPTQ